MLLILSAGGWWNSFRNTQGVSFLLKLPICPHFTTTEILAALTIKLQNTLQTDSSLSLFFLKFSVAWRSIILLLKYVNKTTFEQIYEKANKTTLMAA